MIVLSPKDRLYALASAPDSLTLTAYGYITGQGVAPGLTGATPAFMSATPQISLPTPSLYTKLLQLRVPNTLKEIYSAPLGKTEICEVLICANNTTSAKRIALYHVPAGYKPEDGHIILPGLSIPAKGVLVWNKGELTVYPLYSTAGLILHAASHEKDGEDEINVDNLLGLLANAQKIAVSKDDVLKGTQPKINFKSSDSSVDITATENVGQGKVDVDLKADHTKLSNKEVAGVIDHALQSVRDGHLYNNPAWKRLLATQPSKAFEMLIKTWTAQNGEQSPYALTFDGTYIYAGFSQYPVAKITKINPATMTTVAVWTGASGESLCETLVFDGTYIYAGLYTNPAKVIKINPATMTTVAVWTGESGEYNSTFLTFDGTYVYIGLNTLPAKVIKINPVTMTTVAVWTGISNQDHCLSLTFDGTYVYIGLNTSPAKVIKINPATMTTVAVWTGESGEDKCQCLTFDGTYIYAGLSNTENAFVKIIKINSTTMTTVSIWEEESDDAGRFLIFDGTYIYSIMNYSKLTKINPVTMESVCEAVLVSYGQCLTFDGTYIYVGCAETVIRLILPKEAEDINNKFDKTIPGEITGLPEKTEPADDDKLLIEDSESDPVGQKKRLKISNLPSGSAPARSKNYLYDNFTRSFTSVADAAASPVEPQAFIWTGKTNESGTKIVLALTNKGIALNLVNATEQWLKLNDLCPYLAEVNCWIEMLVNCDNGSNDAVFGLAISGAVDDTPQGIYFFFDSFEDDITIKSVTKDGSGTTTETCQVYAANTFIKLRIEVSDDGSTVKFYVNDVLKQTHTTNIPSADLQPYVWKSEGQNTYIKYIEADQDEI